MKTLSCTLVLFFLAGGVAAEENKGNFPFSKPRPIIRDGVGAKGGLLNGGKVFITNLDQSRRGISEIDTKVGVGVGVFFDVSVRGRFYLSPAADMLDIVVEGEREKLLDLSLGLKYAFGGGARKVLWRPTFALGYGYLADYGFIRRTDYMTLKYSIEGVFFTPKHYAFMIESGIFATSGGGNSEVRVKSNPRLFVRVGVLY